MDAKKRGDENEYAGSGMLALLCALLGDGALGAVADVPEAICGCWAKESSRPGMSSYFPSTETEVSWQSSTVGAGGQEPGIGGAVWDGSCCVAITFSKAGISSLWKSLTSGARDNEPGMLVAASLDTDPLGAVVDVSEDVGCCGVTTAPKLGMSSFLPIISISLSSQSSTVGAVGQAFDMVVE